MQRPGAARPPHAAGSPGRRRLRWALLALLAAGWLVMAYAMWRAYWVLPSPELLQRQRMITPPTLGSVGRLVLLSLLELAVLSAVLWPRWERFYATRLFAAAVAGAAWFLFTTPLAITSVQRVHRIWFAVMVVLLLISWLAALAVGTLDRLRRRAPPQPSS
jgi:hypothetical protein